MTRQARFDIVAHDKTQPAFAAVKRSLGGLERAFGGMKTVIGAVLGSVGMGALIKESLELGDTINVLSQSLGASTEALSQYRYAAKLSNIEFETLTKTWETMQRNIGMAAMGTGRAKDYIKNLGIDAKEFAKLAPEVQFEKLADKLMAIQNPSERAAYAFRIMGAEYAKMLPLMEGGSESLRALRAEADQLGLTITRDMAASMDNANDQIDKVKMAFSGLGVILANQLAPVILRIGEAFLQAVQWIREHQEALAAVAKLVMGGGALILGFRALAIGVAAAEAALIACANALKVFLVTFSVSPVTALTSVLNGVSVSAVAASGALGQLKIAAGVLFAAFAGWQIGTWLRDNFEVARVAGYAFIGGLLTKWEQLKFGVQAIWAAISAGFSLIVDAMKAKLAAFIEFAANGLAKLPMMGEAANAMNEYAAGLKQSGTAAADFSTTMAALNANYAAAKAKIDAHVTGLVAHEMGLNKAKVATQQHAQATQYAGLALGELGKKQKEVNKLLEEGKRLTEELRTPMEVYQDNLTKVNLLLEKGYINQETYHRALKKYQKDYEDAAGITEALEKQKKAYEDHVHEVTGIFRNGLFAFMDEGFSGMVKSFENALKAMAADAAAAELGRAIFGSVASGGDKSGNLLNQFLGDGFGKLFSFDSFGGFRAHGGAVTTGKSYVVGEQEPELFTPGVSGFITPMSKLPAASNPTTVVINNYIQTPNVESFKRAEGNLAARMKMQMEIAGRRNL